MHIRQDHGHSNYPDMDLACVVCSKVTNIPKSFINYYDHGTCYVCGRSSDDTRGRFIMHYRHFQMRQTRREFAKQLGIKGSTLKKYEWCEPSPKVFKAALHIIRKHIKERCEKGEFNTE